MGMEVYSIINTMITLFLGGGWFLHWRASRRKANGEAKQTEAQANKEAQEYYNTTLADVNRTLNEVREERDHYKEDRNTLRDENETMVQKYNELQNKLTDMEIEYKKDIARLGRRLDCLSPFLCGVAGCLHRKRVNVMDEEEINTLPTKLEKEKKQKNENGNDKEG